MDVRMLGLVASEGTGNSISTFVAVLYGKEVIQSHGAFTHLSCFPCLNPRRREARCKIEDSGRSRPRSRFAADPPENEKPAPSDDGERNKSARKFTFRDLATATHNFREIVAIKQLKQDGYQGSNEFLVEVLMLTVLRHPNLVNLIGYCAEGDERLLAPIDWNTRMKIALGAAKGLTYLHDVANPPVIYRDMKAANVLLDENFNPKLFDFGLAKLGCGHCKKLAPEYEKLGSSFKKAKSVLIGKVSIVDCDIRAYAAKQSSLHMMHNKYEQSCRYEGPRTAEALTEFVNTEGGTLQIIFTKNS
ncbi:hypothetical protein ZIOFF_069181 [Zingiber officinale]|uniref:Protein kinase domain-containing protein n=1 Tax=Zingiber officinale TaxID=94328 RepID=A0A8J5C3S5_ZINOF|nr:hypothetical protein ZIOFF_069181 [Zingiber officinale]